MSVIPALRKLRQEDYFEQVCGKLGLCSVFKASQSYIEPFLRGEGRRRKIRREEREETG